MDKANIVVLSAKALDLPKIEVVTSDHKRRIVNLEEFSTVHCFPKDLEEWKKVKITENGMNVTWDCGFEVHADQTVDWSEVEENVKFRA